MQARKPYPCSLSNRQWQIIKDWIPEAKKGGRPRTTDMRQVVDACFYLIRSGCAWRYLPGDFPPWQTVYDYFSAWMRLGIWVKIHSLLRVLARAQAGKKPLPRLGIVDSQSVRAHHGEERARDGFKKVTGRKRSVLVDSLGLFLEIFIHKGNDQDFRGLMALLHRLPADLSPEIILADKAYRFPTLREEAESRNIKLEVVGDDPSGSNLKPQRWIVERSFAWLNHYRRLSRDYERKCHTSRSVLFISQIQLLLGRIAPKTLFSFLLSKHPHRAKFASNEYC